MSSGPTIRILFLDFDGVLNDSDFLSKAYEDRLDHGTMRGDDPSTDIDPVRVELLNRIVEDLDVLVVISSSWRILFTTELLQDFLKRRGYRGPDLMDRTDSLSGHRCDEIRQWLKWCGWENENFCIIDDSEDAGFGFEDNFVRTNDGNGVLGLRECHVEQARRILTKERP